MGDVDIVRRKLRVRTSGSHEDVLRRLRGAIEGKRSHGRFLIRITSAAEDGFGVTIKPALGLGMVWKPLVFGVLVDSEDEGGTVVIAEVIEYEVVKQAFIKTVPGAKAYGACLDLIARSVPKGPSLASASPQQGRERKPELSGSTKAPSEATGATEIRLALHDGAGVSNVLKRLSEADGGSITIKVSGAWNAVGQERMREFLAGLDSASVTRPTRVTLKGLPTKPAFEEIRGDIHGRGWEKIVNFESRYVVFEVPGES